jgi:hypothetical protein
MRVSDDQIARKLEEKSAMANVYTCTRRLQYNEDTQEETTKVQFAM